MSIKTVLGEMEPSKLGMTLTHEHIRMNYNTCYIKPPRDDHMTNVNKPMELQNMGFIHQYPYSNLPNLNFIEETLDDLISEVKEFKRLGGDTLVEVTTHGIEPDYEFLKKVSEATGVNVVCSTGYYLGHTLSKEVLEAPVNDLVEAMVKDLREGRNGIKAGCIGEVGCQYPLADSERKSLIASAKAQAIVGCPLIIHPGRDEQSPFEIIDILKENGADISKTVMSHLDRTLMMTDEIMLKFAAYSSCYLEFDLFGIEVSHYQANLNYDFPSDAQRVRMIKLLIDNGYLDRIVVAHDIHTKHRLIKYGGHGYGHIIENIVPKMLSRGITQKQVDRMLIENPKRWLTY